MKNFLINLWTKLFGKIQNAPSTKVISKKPKEVCGDNCVCKKAKSAKVKQVKVKSVKAKIKKK